MPALKSCAAVFSSSSSWIWESLKPKIKAIPQSLSVFLLCFQRRGIVVEKYFSVSEAGPFSFPPWHTLSMSHLHCVIWSKNITKFTPSGGNSKRRFSPLLRKGPVGWFSLHRRIFCCTQVYSSMERLSIHEERKTPPPTKRSLSEEKDDRLDSLGGLKSRDRSWVIGSPEMWVPVQLSLLLSHSS